MVIFIAILLIPLSLAAQDAQKKEKDADTPGIELSEEIDESVKREAAQIKQEFEVKLEAMTPRSALKWDKKTIRFVSDWFISVPKRIPGLLSEVAKNSKLLGLSGTAILVLFLAALFYSFFWHESLITWIAGKLQPVVKKISKVLYRYVVFVIDVATSALIPALLLGSYGLLKVVFKYEYAWYLLMGRLLWLWFFATVISRVFKDLLVNEEVSPRAAAGYGPNMFRWIRWIIIYSVVVLSLFWGAAIFKVRADVVALIRFAVSTSIVALLFLFLLKRKAIFSILPTLEYPIYKTLIKFTRVFYYPLILITLSGALLWTFGYDKLGIFILTKIWTTSVAFIVLVIVYHAISIILENWTKKIEAPNVQAHHLASNLSSVLSFVTILASFVIILNLLGLLDPIERIMSFTLMRIGESEIKLWVLLKAIIIVIAFYFLSKLLQSYLNYKVYPSLGVDPGLGFVLNTLLKYILFAIAISITLKIVGIDLKILLVFAGAIGIGVGLGLQSLAANIISGFTIIFGRKIRKGDWIEVDGKLGKATDIYLSATRIKTRDDVEYLIPNSNFINTSIINYSFSSPLIRIHMPVGVSYSSDPNQVREILLKVAEQDERVSTNQQTIVRFMGYGESSLNFELLVWINVKKHAVEDVRSSLYFTAFEELRKSGIQIPFPQRDIHIKSGAIDK
ncbi:MAG: mechanosensitive ion channel domain-containing protein [Pseudomonadota bacterium]